MCNYFDFNRMDNSYIKFMLYSGFKPGIEQFVDNYKNYTESQQKDIQKQFEKQFSVWWNEKKVVYTPSQYIEAARSFLPKIQTLPLSMQQQIIKTIQDSAEKISHNNEPNIRWLPQGIAQVKLLKKYPKIAQQVIQNILKLPEWKEIRDYFYTEPIPAYAMHPSDRIPNALGIFNADMVERAMKEDLFNLKGTTQYLIFTHVNLVLDWLKQPEARQMFFQCALDYDCWLPLIKDTFPSNINYYLSDNERTIERHPFAEDMPGEQILRKILTYFNPTSELSYRDRNEFKKKLILFFDTNKSFRQYVAEQAVLYGAVLKEKEGIAFYPPLRQMIDELRLNACLQELQGGQFPLHYSSTSTLNEFMNAYYTQTT